MTTSSQQPKVAISSEFLKSFSNVPRSKQKKVRRFINKFENNPRSPGINYEKIQNARDPNLRSARIDQQYRAILLQPEDSRVFLLLHVDKHDDAYQWAQNKVCRIHPETGSLQVIDVEEEVVEKEVETPDEQLFEEVSDNELLELGVPDILIPLVRNIRTEQDLENARPYLPEEAYEGLFYVSAGDSVEQAKRELAQTDDREEVDTDDYEEALEDPDSKRRFHVVEDEQELQEMLNAPLALWRVFLHPSQRRLVTINANGPVRVLGGAGTGKTVVAMHRTRYLLENVFTEPDDRILFTTFTRNLAADLKENLAMLLEPDDMERVEVINLDRWVSNFLKQHDYNFDIDYGKRTEKLWNDALNVKPQDLDYSDPFYRDEWERVIQPNGITELKQYMRVTRYGRGTPLHRKKRKQIWPVFEEYRTLLNEEGLKERDDAIRDARMVLKEKGDILPYSSIIVDEAQDMGKQAFKLIRRMIPGGDQKHDIFIVGDTHQRIYKPQVVLSHCDINIVGRGYKLRINYRTTEENRDWAVKLLEGETFDDLDGGVDKQDKYKSLLHGNEPQVNEFDSFEEEVAYIANKIKELDEEERKSTCVVARTNNLVDQYEAELKNRGLDTYSIRRSRPEDRQKPGVRLATMHRVKGLEFDRVIVASVNEGVVPLPQALADPVDEKAREESIKRERSLLYVSATRAKKSVTLTSYGEKSHLIRRC